MASPTITYTPDPALSYFPTPAQVADDLVFEALCPGYGQGEGANGVPQVRVLEPSAGEGHLARLAREHLPFAHITAVEPSPVRAAALRALPDMADVVVEATLEDYLGTVAWAALAGEWEPFDLVFMNPPFTLAGHPEAWAEHVLAVYQDPHLLAPGAMVGAITPHTVVTGKSKLVRAVRDLLGTAVGRYSDGERLYERGRVRLCERGAFAAVGAGIRPVLMWIEKPSAAGGGLVITPYYADDSVTLYCGDCREILPQLNIKVDCAIADPPYEETSLGWDRWPTGWLETVATVTDSMWCFLPLRQFAEPPYRGQEFRAAGWRLSHDIEPDWDADHDHVTWEKHNGSGFAKDRFKRVHEPVSHWYQGKWADVRHEVPRVPAVHKRGGQNFVRQQPAHTGTVAGRGYADDGMRLMRSVMKVRNVNGRAIHPTEKPVAVLDLLIRYACPPGGLVLDPCAGSCSTGVAARMSGRRAVLIEADEAMCEKAVRLRLARDVLPLGAS